ncbi:MAG: inorganic phosphate transporter [Odoribacteraceae bacterium]|jgi:PiT family inorganic phosphate transporter|nr:inorganic phosphate transporter [Odoribacteraceae bacterium]
MLSIIIITIIIALLFDFLNGMNDAANSIATIVATRVFSPATAVLWAAFWNFAAIFVFGIHVAKTMGGGIVNPLLVNEYLILAALIGSVLWVWICTRFGLPISVSHALIGGLIGPAWFAHGSAALFFSGIFKIAVFIVLSPLIGLVLGFLMMCLTMFLFRRRHPARVEGLFKGMQMLSSAVFSLGHGANDAQKTMGIIAVLLFSVAGSNEFVDRYLYSAGEFYIPTWLIVTCYTVIALGTIVGGKKVMKTLGDGLAKLKPVQGFCAETSGALTLIGTAVLGVPVSTTHTITGSIIGTGITKGVASVRWATATHIMAAWVFTIPATILMSGAIYWIISLFVPTGA